jgi:hypothetical protein
MRSSVWLAAVSCWFAMSAFPYSSSATTATSQVPLLPNRARVFISSLLSLKVSLAVWSTSNLVAELHAALQTLISQAILALRAFNISRRNAYVGYGLGVIFVVFLVVSLVS